MSHASYGQFWGTNYMNCFYGIRKIFLLSIFAFLFCGCSAVPTFPVPPDKDLDNHVLKNGNSLPKNPLYVVAMNIETTFGKKNELVVLDADTFEESNRTRLMDDTLFLQFSQDPMGRIWIGYAGTLENSTKRVDVFQPDGTLLKSLELCTWPNVRISFAADRAFVPCYLNGFHARLAVIDLATLEVEKMIELEAEPHFMLLASGANEKTVVVVGGSKTHATLFFIDPQTLEFQHNVSMFGGGNIYTVTEYETNFVMLNRSSSLDLDNPIDVRIVQLGTPPTISDINLAERSPFLGFIENETLWTYHHSVATSKESEKRYIAKYDLVTGEMHSWPLPDYWWAGDMIMLNGKIVLTRRHSLDPNETDGLYEFNPESGKLTQILELPGAHLLLAPN